MLVRSERPAATGGQDSLPTDAEGRIKPDGYPTMRLNQITIPR